MDGEERGREREPGLHKTVEAVCVAVEDDGRRWAAKSASGARILVCSQAIDGIATRIIDSPSADAISKVLLVADSVVEARADGGREACSKRSDKKGGEMHIENDD